MCLSSPADKEQTPCSKRFRRSYLFYTVSVVIIAAAFDAARGSGLMSALGFEPGLILISVAVINMFQSVLQGSWFWGLVWLVLIVAGAVVQSHTSRNYAFDNESYAKGSGS